MRKLERILVPVDFSACSRAALDHAAFLGQHYRAAVDVLHVWQPPRGVSSRWQQLETFAKSEMGQEMQSFLAQLKRRGVAAVRGRLEVGEPVKTILEVADSDHYDLVVMGSHGNTGLLHMIHGSVAELVVRQCSRPVLTIREPRESPVFTSAEALAL